MSEWFDGLGQPYKFQIDRFGGTRSVLLLSESNTDGVVYSFELPQRQTVYTIEKLSKNYGELATHISIELCFAESFELWFDANQLIQAIDINPVELGLNIIEFTQQNSDDTPDWIENIRCSLETEEPYVLSLYPNDLVPYAEIVQSDDEDVPEKVEYFEKQGGKFVLKFQGSNSLIEISISITEEMVDITLIS